MYYLDTVKSFLYLLLGVSVGKFFWDYVERYFKRSLLSVNPVWFLAMVVWGASGFFFFSPALNILPNLFHPILKLFLTAIPDWDIPLYVWANFLLPDMKWEILQHRSWLFSSNIIPILLIIILRLSSILNYPPFVRIHHHFNTIYSISIGLFVGISSHLLGDIILGFIPRGDVGFTISSWNPQTSFIWLVFNIFIGIYIPLCMVRLTKR